MLEGLKGAGQLNHRYRELFDEWVLQRPERGWETIAKGSKYGLWHNKHRVALCYGGRGFVNVFLDGAVLGDVESLDLDPIKHPPRDDRDRGHVGVTLWVSVHQIQRLLDWIGEQFENRLSVRRQPGGAMTSMVALPGRENLLRDELRNLLMPSWPHGYEQCISKVQHEFKFAHHRPVYFVGNVESIARPLILFVGSNPNIRPADTEECKQIDVDFDPYWESRLNYFRGPSFRWAHYQVHAAALAGFIGWSRPPTGAGAGGDLLHAMALAVELCPLSSARSGNIFDHLANWQADPTLMPFRLALHTLELAIRLGQPAAIVARYPRAFRFLQQTFETGPANVPGLRGAAAIRLDGISIPLAHLGTRATTPERAFDVGVSLRSALNRGDSA